jgi:hypothetical protein
MSPLVELWTASPYELRRAVNGSEDVGTERP